MGVRRYVSTVPRVITLAQAVSNKLLDSMHWLQTPHATTVQQGKVRSWAQVPALLVWLVNIVLEMVHVRRVQKDHSQLVRLNLARPVTPVYNHASIPSHSHPTVSCHSHTRFKMPQGKCRHSSLRRHAHRVQQDSMHAPPRTALLVFQGHTGLVVHRAKSAH